MACCTLFTPACTLDFPADVADIHVFELQENKLHRVTVNQYETIVGSGLIRCWVTNGLIDCFQINNTRHEDFFCPSVSPLQKHLTSLRLWCIIDVSAFIYGYWCCYGTKQEEVTPPSIPPTPPPHLPQFLDREGYELQWLKDISWRVSALAAENITEVNERKHQVVYFWQMMPYFYLSVIFQINY